MPVLNRRHPLRLLVSAAAALLCLCCLTGCYSEFLGPAPDDILMVKDQPGGSFRLGRIHRVEYTVHLFWGIWTPKKTNAWTTLKNEVRGKGAAGIYNLQVETYMPWWHIFPAWLTGGIVDISAHSITADPFSYAGNPALNNPLKPPTTAPAPPTAPPSTPAAAPPTANPADPTPTQKPPEPPLIEGDPHRPDTPAPRPGRDPSQPTAPPPPVTEPQ